MQINEGRFDVNRYLSTKGMKFSREPLYSCPECRDTGFVMVFAPCVIQEIIYGKNEFEVDWNHTVATLCVCEKAEKKERIEIPVFEDARWHFNAHKAGARIRALEFKL